MPRTALPIKLFPATPTLNPRSGLTQPSQKPTPAFCGLLPSGRLLITTGKAKTEREREGGCLMGLGYVTVLGELEPTARGHM